MGGQLINDEIVMQKTLFNIKQMDCSAEEQLVRMQLEPLEAVKSLRFDLNQRMLTIYHDGDLDKIGAAISRLNLGSTQLSTESVDEAIEVNTDQEESRLLWIVLLINAALFIGEFTFGLLANSMGLVADSLDMLADAFVYGLSLLAVGGSIAYKKRVARWSGLMQMGLAILGLIEVVRRFLLGEGIPNFRTMLIVSLLALTGNIVCLVVLQRTRSDDAHMQASMIFTSNDVVINLSVIIAAILVSWLDSRLPDLIIGSIVFVIVLRGALRILQLSRT